MNKSLTKIKELQNYWTDKSDFLLKSNSETIQPISIKSFSTYNLSTNVNKYTKFGDLGHTCCNSTECASKTKQHIENAENNNDKQFKINFLEQIKERQPLLKDSWQVLSRTESYVESCHICNAVGHVDCTTCDTYGTPTGKVSCGSCWGSGRKSCGSCSGSGKSNDKTCFSCMGSGKKSCFSCGGNGKVTCGSCDGSLIVTCGTCEGHKYFTHYEESQFFMNSNADISWESDNTKDWINDYIENEISNKPSHIDLMNTSEWHFHTLNASSLAELPYTASIQGQLTATTSKAYNDKKEFDCHFLGEELLPYQMDFIFDEYLLDKSEKSNKNNFEEHISFFNNKTIENIVDDKGQKIPTRSKMIKESTRTHIQTTFNKVSKIYKDEQNDIDIKDIAVWALISNIFFAFLIVGFGLFSNAPSLDFQNFNIFNIVKNTGIMTNFIGYVEPVKLLVGSVLLLPFTMLIKKIFASSKESPVRFTAWYIVLGYLILSICLASTYPVNALENIEWGFNWNNLESSWNAFKTVCIDVGLLSLLLGILKARRINCIKVRNLSTLLKNDTLKKMLGYD